MRKRLITTVKGTLTSLYVNYNGLEIGMSYNGNDEYKSTDNIEINSGILSMVFHFLGFNGTDWSVNIIDGGTNENIYKKSGSIQNNNQSIINESINIT